MKDVISIIHERIDQLSRLAQTKKKESVFFVQFFPSPRDSRVLVPRNRETFFNVIGFCEIGDVQTLLSVCDYLDGKVDYLFFDADKKLHGLDGAYSEAVKRLKKTEVYTYGDNNSWTNALLALILQVSPPQPLKKALLVGDGNLTYKMALALVEQSYQVSIQSPSRSKALPQIVEALNLMKNEFELAKVSVFDPSARESFDVLVGTEMKTTVLNEECLASLGKNAVLIDGGIGTFSQRLVEAAHERKLSVFRLDNRAAISAVVHSVLETRDLVKKRMGRDTIAGIGVVAGGIMGHRGDVILDSISNPSTVIGIADGGGRVLQDDLDTADKSKIQRIESLIGSR